MSNYSVIMLLLNDSRCFKTAIQPIFDARPHKKYQKMSVEKNHVF